MAVLNIALVGAGPMGHNHARVIGESSRARLKVVIDRDLSRAWGLAQKVGCTATRDVYSALRCDAVIIASSTDTHVELALPLLAAGRPLLVEKPVATEPDDVRKLVAEAESCGVPLMCGFVERFNPVIPTALAVTDAPASHIMSVRHSPPIPRSPTSVTHDLLIHDIDLAMRFAGDSRVTRSSGVALVPAGADVAEASDCVLQFDSGAIATLTASRTSQRKIRQLLVETPTSLLELDLLRQDISVYRHVAQQQMDAGLLTYRAETVVDVPFVRHSGEPLALQLEHFLDVVNGRADAGDELRSIVAPHEVAACVERSALATPATTSTGV